MFLDKTGQILLAAGDILDIDCQEDPMYIIEEFSLGEGEKLVGIKSI
jgi:hypothetical protein